MPSEDRYYVQSETVRGEGRVHYIVDRQLGHRTVAEPSRNKKRVEEKCDAMNAAIRIAAEKGK